MKAIFVLLGFVAAAQAFLDFGSDGKACFACCGLASQGCCNTCGLDPSTFGPNELVASKRSVLSTKSFIDDLNHGLDALVPDFSGPDSGCYDCCGKHPCCNTCGIDESIFNHYYPQSGLPDLSSVLGHHGATPEPQSPEKDESYGTEGHIDGHFGGIPHFPDITDLLKPVHAYYDKDE